MSNYIIKLTILDHFTYLISLISSLRSGLFALSGTVFMLRCFYLIKRICHSLGVDLFPFGFLRDCLPCEDFHNRHLDDECESYCVYGVASLCSPSVLSTSQRVPIIASCITYFDLQILCATAI